MVKVKNDLTGKIFGRLKVLGQAEDYINPTTGKRSAQWLCECNCEEHNKVIVRAAHLKDKNKPTQSCGCLAREQSSKANKKKNKFDLSGKYGIGWTLNTNEEFYFDLEDYDKIKDICWEGVTQNNMRVLTGYDPKTKRQIKMHSILGYSKHDHIDRNEFNNLKTNLRPATCSENAMNRTVRNDNSSGVTGVWWNKKNQNWCADIGKNRKRIFLGCFIDKNDAIKARLRAEKEHFGEFAPQQHLFEEYEI